MQNPLTRILRRFRYGREVVLVSGLPRSGTSMMMKMLEAGGVPIMTDGVREADRDNPKGYFEVERPGEGRGQELDPRRARQGTQGHQLPSQGTSRRLRLPGGVHAP
jgi:hypothetical protein